MSTLNYNIKGNPVIDIADDPNAKTPFHKLSLKQKRIEAGRTLARFLNKHEKEEPNWASLSIILILRHAFANLCHYALEKNDEISWSNPWVELQYSIKWDWDKNTIIWCTLNDDEIKTKDLLAANLSKAALEVRNISLFQVLTNSLVLSKKSEKLEYLLPESIAEQFKNLSPKAREAEILKLAVPFTLLKTLKEGENQECILDSKSELESLQLPFTVDIENNRFTAIPFFQIKPLFVNYDQKTAYYPIVVGMTFYLEDGKVIKPPDLTKKGQALFWAMLLANLNKYLEEKSHFPLSWTSTPILITPAKEIPKVPKVRHSSHFVEQKLKYDHPKKNISQPSLFDALSPELKGIVDKEEIKYEGIRPTPSEDRLINAIFRLLREKSESNDVSSEKFYKGNYEINEVALYGGEKLKPSVLKIKPAELYKAYLDSDVYSGRDIADINEILDIISNKKYLFTYERTRHVRVGKITEERVDRITEAQPLLRVLNYIKDMTTDEAADLDKGNGRIFQTKGELIIALNPILTDQIDKKWVDYPQDINRRTIIAAGGHPKRVTEAAILLRDRCMQSLSAKRTQFEFNVETLPHALHLEKYVKQGRKKLIAQTIQKAVQTCKNLNLILNVTECMGAAGQTKYIFNLNSDFE